MEISRDLEISRPPGKFQGGPYLRWDTLCHVAPHTQVSTPPNLVEQDYWPIGIENFPRLKSTSNQEPQGDWGATRLTIKASSRVKSRQIWIGEATKDWQTEISGCPTNPFSFLPTNPTFTFPDTNGLAISIILFSCQNFFCSQCRAVPKGRGRRLLFKP